MPETPEEDLGYLDSMDNSPEPEEEVVEAAPEPEEEPADDTEAQEEPEAEGDDEPEQVQAAKGQSNEDVQVEPRRRAETRIQKLANERAQEREARIRAEAKLEALQQFRPSSPAPDNAEAVRRREEKLSLMEPLEKAVFLQDERLQQIQHQQLVSELRSQDMADKSAFEARAVVDPRYARHKADVEAELRDLRSKGINATREQVLAQVIGKKLLSEKPRKAPRDAAARRVAATQGKPVGARNNPAPAVGKGDSLADLESRLKGKSFNSMFNN